MSVSLREITEDNFKACIDLKVSEDQKFFVAPNVRSIAESKIYPYLIPLAVYSGEELVGFTLHGKDPETKRYYIVRLMIDEKFQGKGFGKGATLKLIEKVGENEDFSGEIFLFFVPGNESAERLYTDLGFTRTGVVDEDGEIEMNLKLTDSTKTAI